MQGDKNGRNPGQDTKMSKIEYKRHPSYIKYPLADIFIIVMCAVLFWISSVCGSALRGK